MKIGIALRDLDRRVCAIHDGWVIDLLSLAGAEPPTFLADLGSFLRGGNLALESARDLLARADDPEAVGATQLQETRLIAPYVEGAKIVCHAVNYHAHAGEVGVGESPYFFMKPASSVIGPGEAIEAHTEMSAQLDFETELAVIVGRESRNVRLEDAYDHVAGYTVLNDVSHREYQFSSHSPDLRKRYGMNWTQGKGLDGSCPIGPWITFRDELPEPYPLQIRCWVDDTLRQDTSTESMIYKVPALLAEITRGMTFYPGDVIATGTPPGTILDSGGPWLQPGNVVRCEIESLGVLENTVG